MRSHKDDRKQGGDTAYEDKSACLVTNLSPFRSPICHHFDVAMGMHPKFCKLRVLPWQLEDIANMESMFGQGGKFISAYALFTRAFLEAVPAVFCRRKQCRQE